MDLNNAFQDAVATSKTLTKKPDNETLLLLYGYYKQATEGDQAGDGPANPFDFVAKAKFEAYQKLKGTPKEKAMQEYIDLVNKLNA